MPYVNTAVDVAVRLRLFALERYPFAVDVVMDAFAAGRDRFAAALRSRLRREHPSADTTPGVTAAARWEQAVDELIDACEGLLRRVELEASLTPEERREILRGMVLTRATDNRLKAFFTGGEVRYRDTTFQGKGFRSLGQEAIYAAAIRLRRGARYRTEHGWQGDVLAPMIRDLGVALAMRNEPATIRMVLSAQMAKAGPPMNG